MRSLLLAPLVLLPLLLTGCAEPAQETVDVTDRGPGTIVRTAVADEPTIVPTGEAPSPAPASATPTTGTSGAAAAPIRQCSGPSLDIRLASTDSGAGNIDYEIAFTNRGPGTCTVSGAPRVSVVGADGNPLGQEATGTGAEGPLVRLRPGTSATTAVRAVNVGTDGGPLGDRCTPKAGVALAVDAPNSGRYEQVPVSVRGCAEKDVSFLTVGVLTRSGG